MAINEDIKIGSVLKSPKKDIILHPENLVP
jgi:hypothetical protein